MVGGGFTDEGLRFREGIGGSYAPREIGQVCRIASGRLLDDGGVFHGECSVSIRACFKMLFHVPGARLLLIFPATVTVPDFRG